jgi:hypothetical protein
MLPAGLVFTLGACASNSGAGADPPAAGPSASAPAAAAGATKTVDLGHFVVNKLPVSGTLTISQDPEVTSCQGQGDLPHGVWSLSFTLVMTNNDTRGDVIASLGMRAYDAAGNNAAGNVADAEGYYASVGSPAGSSCPDTVVNGYFNAGQSGSFTGAIVVSKAQMTTGTLTLTSTYEAPVASIPMSSLGLHIPSGN